MDLLPPSEGIQPNFFTVFSGYESQEETVYQPVNVGWIYPVRSPSEFPPGMLNRHKNVFF